MFPQSPLIVCAEAGRCPGAAGECPAQILCKRREQPALEDVGHRAGRGHGDSVGTSSGKEPGLGGRAGRSQGQEHFAFVSKSLLSELSLQLANFSFRRTKPDKVKQQGKKKTQTPAS